MFTTPTNSLGSFLAALRASRVLTAAQLVAVERCAVEEPDDGGALLAQRLLEWGWLTSFQIEQLARGQGHNLVLDSYHILERVGEGATGFVFKARHAVMQRLVALKVIRRELLADAEVVERFYREVRLLSQLNHPNIVHAYDAGAHGATQFLVMEYVQGIDLDRLVRQSGPLAPSLAADYIHQAAVGLQYAHERGLVHRDIKPSNLLVTTAPADGLSSAAPPGLVKILDLGLARVPRAAHEQHIAGLTQSGKGMMGTPDYLAPEQALDFGQADGRSDLYSLGCTLHFLLTGRPPFPEGTLAQKLMRHQMVAPPPLTDFRADVPPLLSAVLARLLAKDPGHRFPTAAALAGVLAQTIPWKSGSHPDFPSIDDGTLVDQQVITAVQRTPFAPGAPIVPAAPTAPVAQLLPDPPDPITARRRAELGRRRRQWLLNAAGVFLLAGLVCLFGFFLSDRKSTAVVSPAVSETDTEDGSASLRDLTVRLRKVRIGGEDPDLLRRDLTAFWLQNAGTPDGLAAAGRLRELPSPLDRLDRRTISAEEQLPWQPNELVAVLGRQQGMPWGYVTSIVYSPDGKLVATGSDDGLVRIWDAASLRERAALKGHLAVVNSAAFGPDGKTLVSVDAQNEMRIWNLADLARPKDRSHLKTAEHSETCCAVAVSPDGKVIAAGGYDARVKLFDVAANGVVKFRIALSGHAGYVRALAFDPTGKTLYSGAEDGLRVWDVAAPTEQTGPPAVPGYILSFTLGKDHLLPICFNTPAGLALWELRPDEKPREVAVLQPKPADRYGPHRVALSPDGEWLASNVMYTDPVQLWRRQDGGFVLYATLEGKNGDLNSLIFSPDGKTLLAGGSNHSLKAWSLVDGKPVERPLPGGGRGGPVFATAVSPTDAAVAFAAQREPALQFWKAGADAPQLLSSGPFPTINNRGALAYAPDGTILYTLNSQKVALWDGRTGPARIAAELPTTCNPDHYLNHLVLSANGRTLAVASGHDAAVWWWDVSKGKAVERPMLRAPRGVVVALALSPDGNTLVALLNETTYEKQGNAAYRWTLRRWNLSSGAPVESPSLGEWTKDPPTALQFAPDGNLALIFAAQGSFALYELTDGGQRSRAAFSARLGTSMRAVAFSPDGKLAVSAGGGLQPLILWDLASGKQVRGWDSLPCLFHGVAFAADGRHFVTANGNGTAYVFRLASASAVPSGAP